MLFFLATQSLWISATVLVMVTTCVAVLGPVVVRRFVLLEKLSSNTAFGRLDPDGHRLRVFAPHAR